MFIPDPGRTKVGELRRAFGDLREELDRLFPEESREKSLMKTKIDEAQLWSYQLLRPEPTP